MKRTYVVWSKTTWANSRFGKLLADPWVDEIMISVDTDTPSLVREFTVRWYDVQGEPTPRLEVFGDSWRVLSLYCVDFVTRLGQLNEKATVLDVCELLNSLGYVEESCYYV